jgi:hypothetical protein
MENRMLANKPSVADIKDCPETFVRQFDEWFKDSTGFREKLLILYKKTDGIFKHGTFLDGTSIALIGRQGHHFHTHYNQLLPIYQGKRWLDDVQSYELSVKLNDINQYFHKKI